MLNQHATVPSAPPPIAQAQLRSRARQRPTEEKALVKLEVCDDRCQDPLQGTAETYARLLASSLVNAYPRCPTAAPPIGQDPRKAPPKPGVWHGLAWGSPGHRDGSASWRP